MTIESMPAPTPGTLAHRLDDGVSACTRCGWRGVPTIIDGEPQHECPACVELDAELARVGRNEPCPCGSTLKFKRCHGR